MTLVKKPSTRSIKAIRKEKKEEVIELPKEPAPEPVVPVKNTETQQQKKRTSPSRLIGKAKQTDYTLEVNAIKLNRGMVILDILKADGSSAYTAELVSRATTQR